MASAILPAASRLLSEAHCPPLTVHRPPSAVHVAALTAHRSPSIVPGPTVSLLPFRYVSLHAPFAKRLHPPRHLRAALRSRPTRTRAVHFRSTRSGPFQPESRPHHRSGCSLARRQAGRMA